MDWRILVCYPEPEARDKMAIYAANGKVSQIHRRMC
jgi:hypothetical protein